ncbi:MAG TPA: ankyrin repeat domain-containing protein [Verrucomicrobiae bacterium]|nr:ankyrin repeat domain-containing protein [Verrucomicrobiae bacterium]
MSKASLLKAIHDDDCPGVKRLLRADPRLATLRVDKAKLYEDQIVHWLYAGDTPLHLAAAGYRVKIVQLLLAAGADPNAAMNHRQSGPLHYAADTGLSSPAWSARQQVATLRCLLEAGARINAPDKNGATPLHRAVRTRGADAVKYLLKAGSDPSLKNKSGSTAFHLAVQNTGRGGSGSDPAKNAQRQIIQYFLSQGVATTLKDGKGKSILDCARSDWIREMVSTETG